MTKNQQITVLILLSESLSMSQSVMYASPIQSDFHVGDTFRRSLFVTFSKLGELEKPKSDILSAGMHVRVIM